MKGHGTGNVDKTFHKPLLVSNERNENSGNAEDIAESYRLVFLRTVQSHRKNRARKGELGHGCRGGCGSATKFGRNRGKHFQRSRQSFGYIAVEFGGGLWDRMSRRRRDESAEGFDVAEHNISQQNSQVAFARSPLLASAQLGKQSTTSAYKHRPNLVQQASLTSWLTNHHLNSAENRPATYLRLCRLGWGSSACLLCYVFAL